MDNADKEKAIKEFSELCLKQMDISYFKKKRRRIRFKFSKKHYVEFAFTRQDAEEEDDYELDEDEEIADGIHLYYGPNEDEDLEEIAFFNTDVLPMPIIKNAICSIIYDILK